MTDWWAVSVVLLGVVAIGFVAAWHWVGDLDTLAAMALAKAEEWRHTAEALPDQARQAWTDGVAWAEGAFEDLRDLFESR